MAPTETLAEQHAATLDALLAAIEGSRSRSRCSPARRRRRGGARRSARLASGELGLVVGTHALIEPDVRFAGLAVCVVDEQHRFGVRQRAALDAKGPGEAAPHVAPHDRDADPADALADRLRRPRHDHDPRAAGRAAAGQDLGRGRGEARGRLRVHPRAPARGPPGLRRLPAGRRLGEAAGEGRRAPRPSGCARASSRASGSGSCTARCRRARRRRRWTGSSPGGLDVLVATTVIEVGIDVPNATVMLIEGAERFGLSQLHQLRGRVGRGAHESHCILFADLEGQLAKRRMEAIAASTDGFELAEVDLALRGEGEILGTLQHGLPRYRVAELPEDAELLAAGAGRGDRAARAPRQPRRAGARPLPRRRAQPLRRRAGRGNRRMRVTGGRLGGRKLLSPPGALARRPADLGPRPRDAVRGPRRRLGPQRPRPLLRHRGAGDRGDLARRRLGRARRPRAGAGAPQRGGARDRQPLRARPRRRGPLPRAHRGALRPRLLRPAV